ncbi:MAG: GNAT family protein [Saprospiraceae bacterium]
MPHWLQPLTLKRDPVRLIPLQTEHREELLQAAADGELWKIWYTSVPSPESMDTYLATALLERAEGRGLPFAVVHQPSGRVIGCTRYYEVDAKNRRLRIGYTWYARSYQRTAVNTTCKYLLLRHAFEQLDCIAVEWETNFHNHPSRRAIARLGAKQDGILRNHRIDSDGCLRDTVLFSVIASEWPTVKKSLGFELTKREE